MMYSTPVILPASGETRKATRPCHLRNLCWPALRAATNAEKASKLVEGRWKLVILFNLFGGQIKRFSELERAIPGISQKMLIQQLRQLEIDGLVKRIVHPQAPPKVEYGMNDWGQALCPAMDALLKWSELREELTASDKKLGGDKEN